MKKLLSSILASTMALSLLSVPVSATEPTEFTEFVTQTATSEFGTMKFEQCIAPQFDEAQLFTDGLAAVKKNGKWGYIDEENNLVIDYAYDEVGRFSEGYALVGNRTEDSWGYTVLALGIVDKQGNYTPILMDEGFGEAQFYTYVYGDEGIEYGQIFHNGYMVIKMNESQFYWVNTQGKVLENGGNYFCSNYNEGYFVHMTNAWFDILTDAEGNYSILNDIIGEDIDVQFSVNQGLLPVFAPPTTEEDYFDFWLLGFWDVANQKWQLEPTFSAYWYQNAYTSQSFFNSSGFGIFAYEDGLYGAADKNGNTVIPFIYENMMPMDFGLIPFKTDGKWGFMDEKCNIIIPNQYDDVTGFSNMGIAVAVKDGNATIIDSKGNSIPGAESMDSSIYFSQTASGGNVVSAPGEYVVIHEDGQVGFAKLEYAPALPTAEDMSVWAVDFVQQAIIADLIPVSLQNRYTSNITRADFATLAVYSICTILDTEVEDLVWEKTGKTLQAHISEYPFLDSSDKNVIAGNALGIVQGRGENTFDPYAEITRQEAAIMLQKMVAVSGLSVSDAVEVSVSDVDSIASWAADSVNYVSQQGIMTTVGDNMFSPLTAYTREQSFATMLKVMETIQE